MEFSINSKESGSSEHQIIEIPIGRVENDSLGETSLQDSKRLKIEDSKIDDVDDEIMNSPYNWCQYCDNTSGKFYYYNLVNKITQWEKPKNFIEPIIIPTQPVQSSSLSYFDCTASFNTKNGSFQSSSETDHWETTGKSSDRATRQMSAFFDVSKFDENREQAKKIREDLKKSNIDWKKYSADKKLEKRKRNNEWLMKDD